MRRHVARSARPSLGSPSERLGDALRWAVVVVALSLGGCAPDAPEPLPVDRSGWSHYGGDAGGSRYSSLSQINRDNVAQLQVAWTYRTGEMSHEEDAMDNQTGCAQCHTGDSKFEATPILADGRLYLSTPWNRIIAIDPESGEELWRHDPHIRTDLERNEGFISRGVAYWEESQASEMECGRRIFMGTVDADLLSVDATTGIPCSDFGQNGVVALDVGVGEVQEGQYGITSPPAVVGDAVVVGTAMGDNRRVDMEHGTVRGYEARSGELIWGFDPIPRDPSHPAWEEWTPEAAAKTGAANAWPPISADVENDMVFVPTGSAAPDFYGGERPGSNLYANSVVALRASTGEIVWHFQVVHHDIWDYDIASQPSLIDVPKDGVMIPAVAVSTKMGFIHLLHRATGEPIYPVEERPVPASDVPGEVVSPTQPFPTFIGTAPPDDVHGGRRVGRDRGSPRALPGGVQGLQERGYLHPAQYPGELALPGQRRRHQLGWGGVGPRSESPRRQRHAHAVLGTPHTPAGGRDMGEPEGDAILDEPGPLPGTRRDAVLPAALGHISRRGPDHGSHRVGDRLRISARR